MIYDVIIKGYSVGITRNLKEAISWMEGRQLNYENRIDARPDQVPNYRTYKC